MECQLDALELDYYDCYIGMDLASRFGFQIAGFEVKQPPPLMNIYIVNDKKPKIVATERPKEECSWMPLHRYLQKMQLLISGRFVHSHL